MAGSFFLAYLLLRNDIATYWMAWWLKIGDLPLALAAITFGGTSLYTSLTSGQPSRLKATLIAIPLIAFIAFLIVLNFWSILPGAEAL